MMLDFLELADGCSSCDGCSVPGPLAAAFTGLLALLWGGLATFLLVDHASTVIGPGVVYACAGAAGFGALLGLAVMAWATVLGIARSTRAIAATTVGVLAILLVTIAVILGYALGTSTL